MQKQNSPQGSTKPEIVTNRMFSGDYLLDNLGHEVINLFQADDGNYYIYLNKDGKIDIKTHPNVHSMILTRTTPNAKKELILGIAIGLKTIEYGEDKTYKTKQDFINNISYGGVTLQQLYNQNKTQPTEDYITYTAEKILLLQDNHYLTFETGLSANTSNIRLFSNKGSQTQRQFFGNHKIQQEHNIQERIISRCYDQYDYDNLNLLINTIVSDYNSNTPKIKCREASIVDIRNLRNYFGPNLYDTMFEVTDIDHYELAFSAAFAYYFKKYPQLLTRLFQKIAPTSLDAFHGMFDDLEDLTIIREKVNRIDIFIRTVKDIVVIENKVHADIGKYKNELTQLTKYYDYVFWLNRNRKPEWPHDILQKNEENAVNPSAMPYTLSHTKKLAFILLVPDHWPYLNCEYLGEYHLVRYSTLYQVIEAYKFENNLADYHLDELLSAMYRHTMADYHTLTYSTLRRFCHQLIAYYQP